MEELESFVVSLEHQPTFHWTVQLDCSSAVRLPSPHSATTSNAIILDDGVCRALCSQFNGKGMSKRAIAEAFVAHNAIDCRFAYSDVVRIQAPMCLGAEGNFIFTITKPPNLKRMLLVSDRVEIYWTMNLDDESRQGGGCVDGAKFLYQYVKVEKINDPPSADSDLLIPMSDAGEKNLCFKDWSGSTFNSTRYSPGILSMKGDFLTVNITKAMAVELATMELPFVVQLNNQNCFGAMDYSLHQHYSGLTVYFDRFLSDLESWL